LRRSRFFLREAILQSSRQGQIHAAKYMQLTYKSKNMTITQKYLPKELLREIDVSLFEDVAGSDSAKQA